MKVYIRWLSIFLHLLFLSKKKKKVGWLNFWTVTPSFDSLMQDEGHYPLGGFGFGIGLLFFFAKTYLDT